MVATVEPSGLTAYCPSTRAIPGSGVRSVSAIFGSSPSSDRVPENRRGWSGPRSWSQNLTGTLSCRIAETFFSLRSLRFFASDSSLEEDGNVGEESTTVPASDATSTWSTPPAAVGDHAGLAPAGRQQPEQGDLVVIVLGSPGRAVPR